MTYPPQFQLALAPISGPRNLPPDVADAFCSIVRSAPHLRECHRMWVELMARLQLRADAGDREAAAQVAEMMTELHGPGGTA